MLGILYVLERPHPGARRLASQQVEYDDPPKRWERFVCTPASGGKFKTDRVEAEPQLHGEALYFATRHTAYLLERAPS
jgi:hypothetical protein